MNGNNNDVVNLYKDNDYFNNWMELDISQRLEGNGKCMYRIKVDGVVWMDVENTDARDFKNVKIFTSDPWYLSHGEKNLYLHKVTRLLKIIN